MPCEMMVDSRASTGLPCRMAVSTSCPMARCRRRAALRNGRHMERFCARSAMSGMRESRLVLDRAARARRVQRVLDMLEHDDNDATDRNMEEQALLRRAQIGDTPDKDGAR